MPDRTAAERENVGAHAVSGAAPEKELGSLRQTAVRRAEAVLAYLSRYTHRVAISNRRLISLGEARVIFRFKDYRRNGAIVTAQ